jgi:hypothetical protein
MSRRKAESLERAKPAKKQKEEEEKEEEPQWVVLVQQDGFKDVVRHQHGKGGNPTKVFHSMCHDQKVLDEDGIVTLAIEGVKDATTFRAEFDACPCPKCSEEKDDTLGRLLSDKDKQFWAAALKLKADGSIDWEASPNTKCFSCGGDGIRGYIKGIGYPGRCQDCKTYQQTCLHCKIVWRPRDGKEIKGRGVCPACGLSKSY